ncbi:MAG: hypothetical protein QW260_06795 [Thermoproteota archaeon]|nr:hypothetical protein [Candidatus Rehaiarchaeum fermentans]
MTPKKIVESYSISYPKMFNIDLVKDPFPWLSLSALFGTRISQQIAFNTFFLFKSEKLSSPEHITKRDWDELVAVLNTVDYIRYDFKTATKLLELSENLMKAVVLIKY